MKIARSNCHFGLPGTVLCLALSGFGCTHDQTGGTPGTTAERKRIPLAPVSAASAGIGAPGAGSMDTRGTGTIATGQGDDPINDPQPGAVPVSGAGVTPGARKGGRL